MTNPPHVVSPSSPKKLWITPAVTSVHLSAAQTSGLQGNVDLAFGGS